MKQQQRLLRLMEAHPVIPVLAIERPGDAVPLARALVAGGLPAIEVTLRTAAALDAIRLIRDEVADAVVGAGTVLNARQFEAARDAGAGFIVSPGTTQELLDIARLSDTPFLPGAMTPSEIMALIEEGYPVLKFFPAEAAGGHAALSALAGPLPAARFCPTGGITRASAPAYLALGNVLCVGGSWVAPADLVRAGAWQRITELAREAAGLRSGLVT